MAGGELFGELGGGEGGVPRRDLGGGRFGGVHGGNGRRPFWNGPATGGGGVVILRNVGYPISNGTIHGRAATAPGRPRRVDGGRGRCPIFRGISPERKGCCPIGNGTRGGRVGNGALCGGSNPGGASAGPREGGGVPFSLGDGPGGKGRALEVRLHHPGLKGCLSLFVVMSAKHGADPERTGARWAIPVNLRRRLLIVVISSQVFYLRRTDGSVDYCKAWVASLSQAASGMARGGRFRGCRRVRYR